MGGSMRLKNKKTGEIGNLLPWVDYKTKKEMNHFAVMLDNREEPLSYNSLAELNEEWEVYEEPETYYYISDLGNIESLTNDHGQNLPEEIWHKAIKRRKEIGNRFETEEETEKAVEKLRAITRLNKCGFKFEGYDDRDRANGGDIVIYAHIDIPNNNLLEEAQPAMLKDLDLLFGGEE